MEAAQACADMDKHSGDSFHYYHFVKSAAVPVEPATATEPIATSEIVVHNMA
jgi:hypothetical protein